MTAAGERQHPPRWGLWGPQLQGCHVQHAGPAELRGQGGHSHQELPGGAAEWGHEPPQVQEHTDPARGHLDPEDGPVAAEEGFDVGTFVVKPVGDCHHHVEGCQEEDEVEVAVTVDGTPLLIVDHAGALLHILLLLSVLCIWATAETATSDLQLRCPVAAL